MNRCIYFLCLAIGLIGLYSSAFAQQEQACTLTVKCVCESQNHMRVVPCPNDFTSETKSIDCTNTVIPEGTCAVNCGLAEKDEAFCVDIPIECKNNERANCLVTLPVRAGCQGSKIDCSGFCVDTSSDVNNCGGCGNKCPSSEFCDSGVCTVPCLPPPYAVCNNVCVNLEIDDNNCGGCGIVCGDTEPCIEGVCGGGG
jgi:hypothetical protein